MIPFYRIRSVATALLACAAFAATACSPSGPTEQASAFGAGDNWANAGGDVYKSHYSTLTDINAENADRLGLAWSYDMDTNRVQEATPVVVGGIMYTGGNLGRAYALNAVTGEEIWVFEPEVDMQANRSACCDQANRGVALSDGKVMVASLDGWLYALDSATGDVVWKVDTITDRTRGYTITGAPEVADDIVVIGNGGAEYDTRGYVTAYNIVDGSQAWRFFTVPHDPADGPQESEALETALKTWDADSRWDIGGGGTVWDAINYDPEFDQIYLGVGNGTPHPLFKRSPSGGDNLYLSSIVALDRKTGDVNWHYQETPRDSWDYTASQPMILTDMEVDGQNRQVILHSPKNGYLFVIDRETGVPLSINAIVRTSWADGYDLETGRPNLTPETSEYHDGAKVVFPGSAGARNWYPAAYDPERELYFASVLDMGNLIFVPPSGQGRPERLPQALNSGAALIFTADLEAVLPTLPPPVQDQVKALPQWQWVKDKPYSSQMRAIDPISGEDRWAVDTSGWQDRNGVLATRSGLVIHGSVDGRLVIRNSDTGEMIREIDTGSSIMAAPMTYRVDGVQYVAVQTGFGGGGWGFVPGYSAAYNRGNANRLLVFKLDGEETPKPDLLPALTVAPEPPAQAPGVTPAMIGQGQGLFFTHCAICHSNQARSTAPDLRRMTPETHEAFNSIVLEGWYLPNGMPRWDDLLSVEDANALHAYLIQEQTTTRARELALEAAGEPLDSRALAIMSSY